jgi:hypothetical protein
MLGSSLYKFLCMLVTQHPHLYVAVEDIPKNEQKKFEHIIFVDGLNIRRNTKKKITKVQNSMWYFIYSAKFNYRESFSI